jgi:tRNA threonylcarbamoyladenosine biosynthesis protein TsaE
VSSVTEPSRAVVTLHGEADTRAYGRHLAAKLAPDGVLLLYGEMGAGKTVLAQGVAEGLRLDPRLVQSPTFTIVHEHRGDAGSMIHVDLFRLAPREVAALGLEELLAEHAVKVVEWAERLPFQVPGAVRLSLRKRAGEEREVEELAGAE